MNVEQQRQLYLEALKKAKADGLSREEGVASARKALDEALATSQYEEKQQSFVKDLPVQQARLDEEKYKYERARLKQIQDAEGISEEEARKKAQKEFEEQFEGPLPPGYGSLEERKESGSPLIPTAKPGEKAGFFEKQVAGPKTIEPKVNWEAVTGKFVQEGMSPEQATGAVSHLKAAYDYHLGATKGVSKEEASRRAWASALKDAQGYGQAIGDESRYIKVPAEQKGFWDKQVTEGAGVPQLTPGQLAIAQEQRRQAVERKVAELESYYDRLQKQAEEEGHGSSVKKKTAEEIRSEAEGLVGLSWADKSREADYKKFIESPEDFRQPGAELAGNVEESNFGYVTRIAAGAYNTAVAKAIDAGGAVSTQMSEAFQANKRDAVRRDMEMRGASPEEVEAAVSAVSRSDMPLGGLATAYQVREASRALKAPELADDAVVFNRNQNLGLVGEVDQVLEALGSWEYAPWATSIAYGGALAGDIGLDVTPEVLAVPIKGARLAAQAGKARKAVGLKGATLGKGYVTGQMFGSGDLRNLLVAESLQNFDEALQIQKAVDAGDMSQAVKLAQEGKTEFSKTFLREVNKVPSAQAGKLVDNMVAGSFGEAKKAVDSVDELLATGRSTGVRSKDVKRSLGILYRMDDDAAKAIDNVAQTKTSLQKILTEVDKAGKLDNLKGILAKDAVSKSVYAATKDMNNFDNVVALTRNTLADKKTVKEVIKTFNETDFGQFVRNLNKRISREGGELQYERMPVYQYAPETGKTVAVGKKGGGVLHTTGYEVAPTYNLTKPEQKMIHDTLDELHTFRRISNSQRRIIARTIESTGRITDKQMREVIEAMIDTVAEQGMVVRARDIARLDAPQQLRYLEPMENRSFGSAVLKDWAGKVADTRGKPSNLSIGQKQLVKEYTSQIASLDRALRRDMRLVMQDADFRKALTGSTAPISKEQALAYLLVKQAGTSELKKAIYTALSQSVYVKGAREQLFDWTYGTSQTRLFPYLTKAERAALDKDVFQVVMNAQKNPENVWNEVNSLIDKFAKQVSGYKNLDGELVKIVNTKLSDELRVGMYYRFQAERIKNNILRQMVNNEIGKAGFDLNDIFTKPQLDALKDTIAKVETGLRAPWDRVIDKPLSTGDLTKAALEVRARRLVLGQQGIAPEELEDVLTVAFENAGANTSIATDAAKKLLDSSNPDNIISQMYDIAEGTNDIAKGILRRNGLDANRISYDEMWETFEKTFSPEQAESLAALYGKDVADELVETFSKNSMSLQDDLYQMLDRAHATGWHKAGKDAKRFAEFLENARYNLILAARPAFHLVNMATAASIIYANTGRLPDVGVFAKVVAETASPFKKPNRIVHVDDFGRAYTENELFKLLQEQGGGSVYAPQTPGASARAAVAAVGDSTRAGDALRFVQDLPQYEDSWFRYLMLRQALKEGRSVQDAVSLARSAMFDVGKIEEQAAAIGKVVPGFPSAEKALRRASLFYSFSRQNLANFLKNVISGPTGWKRIQRPVKLQNAWNQMMTNEEELNEMPSWAQTRLYFGSRTDADRKLMTISPTIPTLDAVAYFSNFLTLYPGVWGPENVGSFLAPEAKTLLGVEDKFNRAQTKVMPEHVAVMQQAASATGSTVEEVISFIVGSPVVGRPGTSREGAVGGMIYDLTPEQAAEYNKYLATMRHTGLTAPLMNYARMAMPEGTKQSSSEGLRSIGERLGITGVATMSSREQQEFYDELARVRAASKYNRDAQKIADKVSRQASPVNPRLEAGEAQKLKPRVKASMTEEQRKLMQLKKEADRLRGDVRAGRISPEEARKRALEIRKEVERVRRLD